MSDIETALGTGTLKASTEQPLAPNSDIPVTFDIEITPVEGRRLVQVKLRFASPPELAGLDYAQFTLPHYHAGKMARQLEQLRKRMK